MPVSRYSRYYNLPKVLIDGRMSLSQRLIEPASPPADSAIHTLIGGETLDQLAFQYYGREDLWWRIADANPNRFPLDWQPGDTLVIPPIRIASRVPRR